MMFKDFINKELVRRTSKDIPLIKSIINNVKRDIIFLNDLGINENSSRKIMGNYYDSLREVLEAISIMDGYKIYSHEAFTHFLKEKGEELLSIKFDRFRKIRNSINYYGKDISIEETKENIEEIKEMIKNLIKKYLGDLE